MDNFELFYKHFKEFLEAFGQKNSDIKELQEKFKDVEKKIGVRIYLQHENIFKTMHRI